MNFFINFCIGILIGFGAITPGISSGVFCVIFGIYETLVNSIINFFKDIKSNFLFLFPIFLGALAGIVLFGNVIKFFFTFYNFQSRFAFIGLILGTTPALFKKVFKNKCIHIKNIIPMLLSFAIGIILIIVEKKLEMNSNFISFNLPYLIFSGFIMSIGIIVPGISNTVLLMCLGAYSTYITAIATLNIAILIPIGIGIILGSIIWLKGINYLLERHHNSTFCSIIGFSLGSIFVLLPGFSFSLTGLVSLIICFICAILSYKLSCKE